MNRARCRCAPTRGRRGRASTGRRGCGPPTAGPHGVSYYFGAYDVGADHLFGDIRRRKDAAEVLRFLMKIRARYEPHVRIYLVLDNLSTHTTKAICRWARTTKVTLVFTPTYASFLNRIEAHFAAYKDFVIAGSDYTSHDELIVATRSYLRHRNHRRKGERIREAENRRKVA